MPDIMQFADICVRVRVRVNVCLRERERETDTELGNASKFRLKTDRGYENMQARRICL